MHAYVYMHIHVCVYKYTHIHRYIYIYALRTYPMPCTGDKCGKKDPVLGDWVSIEQGRQDAPTITRKRVSCYDRGK